MDLIFLKLLNHFFYHNKVVLKPKKILVYLAILALSCTAFGVVTESSSTESKTETVESEAYAHASLVVTSDGTRAVM